MHNTSKQNTSDYLSTVAHMSSSPSVRINIMLKDEQLQNSISGAPDPAMPRSLSTVVKHNSYIVHINFVQSTKVRHK